jgi:hypothetical protein
VGFYGGGEGQAGFTGGPFNIGYADEKGDNKLMFVFNSMKYFYMVGLN